MLATGTAELRHSAGGPTTVRLRPIPLDFTEYRYQNKRHIFHGHSCSNTTSRAGLHTIAEFMKGQK